jgi:UDP-glucose 4-epimerase
VDRRRLLVTGSAGHLGEAIVRVFGEDGWEVVGLDRRPSPSTMVVGSVTDGDLLGRCLTGVDAVIHGATLHQPHLRSHHHREFVETNVTATALLLEAAVAAGVRRFVYTSTTSTFGAAMSPPPGAPAVWVTEDLVPVARNVYGVTKKAAEDLCQLAHQDHDLPVVVLRVARFFPEPDEDYRTYADENVKANEFLYRRVDIEDVVAAHRCALERAPSIGFGRFVVSATTPFSPADTADLILDAPAVVRRLFPDQEAEYRRRGWAMFPRIDRVYDNTRARRDLGWAPRHDFRSVLDCLKTDGDPRSALARAVGSKGYHDRG